MNIRVCSYNYIPASVWAWTAPQNSEFELVTRCKQWKGDPMTTNVWLETYQSVHEWQLLKDLAESTMAGEESGVCMENAQQPDLLQLNLSQQQLGFFVSDETSRDKPAEGYRRKYIYWNQSAGKEREEQLFNVSKVCTKCLLIILGDRSHYMNNREWIKTTMSMLELLLKTLWLLNY